MNREDRALALIAGAACSVCCAPLVIGPLVALGGLIAAIAGGAGVVVAALSGGSPLLLALIALVTAGVTVGVGYALALWVRWRRRGWREAAAPS